MRILHYFRKIRLADGGAVRVVLDLARRQAWCGAEVVLATCDDSDVPIEWQTAAANGRAHFHRCFTEARFHDRFRGILRETLAMHELRSGRRLKQPPEEGS